MPTESEIRNDNAHKIAMQQAWGRVLGKPIKVGYPTKPKQDELPECVQLTEYFKVRRNEAKSAT